MDNLATYIRHIPTSCYWCLNRHLCILQERFAKKDLWIANLVIVFLRFIGKLSLILSFKMHPCLWKSVKNWGHRSHLKILEFYVMTSFLQNDVAGLATLFAQTPVRLWLPVSFSCFLKHCVPQVKCVCYQAFSIFYTVQFFQFTLSEDLHECEKRVSNHSVLMRPHSISTGKFPHHKKIDITKCRITYYTWPFVERLTGEWMCTSSNMLTDTLHKCSIMSFFNVGKIWMIDWF